MNHSFIHSFLVIQSIELFRVSEKIYTFWRLEHGATRRAHICVRSKPVFVFASVCKLHYTGTEANEKINERERHRHLARIKSEIESNLLTTEALRCHTHNARHCNSSRPPSIESDRSTSPECGSGLRGGRTIGAGGNIIFQWCLADIECIRVGVDGCAPGDSDGRVN